MRRKNTEKVMRQASFIVIRKAIETLELSFILKNSI